MLSSMPQVQTCGKRRSSQASYLTLPACQSSSALPPACTDLSSAPSYVHCRWQAYALGGVALGLGAWGAAVAIQDQLNKNKGNKGGGEGSGTTTGAPQKDVKVGGSVRGV